jgi:hypothetical protein
MTFKLLRAERERNGYGACSVGGEAKKHRLLDDLAVAEMLHDNPLEKRRRHLAIPDAFRIDDHDGAARADAQAGSLPTLHAPGTEQQTLSLQQRRKKRIQLSTATTWGAIPADADEHVARIGLHHRFVVRHDTIGV